MLSYSTKNKFVDFLLGVSEGERQIEVIRQILCEQEDFEPYAAFKRIDRNKRGFLASLEIQNFLADSKITQSERNCHLFVQRYDSDGDGQLNYAEFLQSVLTLDNAILRTIVTQRPNYDVAPNQYLSYDVEYALSKIIDKEIQFYLDLDERKEELLSFHDFNYPNSFAVIDKYDTGHINYDNLKAFMKNQSIYPGDDEIIAILRRLDKNDDGLITYKEFVEAIEPVSETLKATANRRNASVRFESPSKTTKMLTHSPLRTEAGQALRKTASPSRIISSSHRNEAFVESHISQFDIRDASPERKQALPPRTPPSYRKEASPSRKEASPTRKEASPTRLIATEKPLANSRRDLSPIKSVESPLTPLKNEARDRSSVNTRTFREGTNSLRKAQIYQDFPRTQSSKSPRESPLKNINTYIGSRNMQTPEKRASLQNRQESAGKTGTRSIKKGLLFENDVEHYLLVQTLKQFIALDKDLEIGKQDVALKSDFNLLDFFRTFDTISNTSIACKDFEAGLIKYGIYPNKDDLALLFKRMDTDNDGLLRFSDFAEIFTPKQKEYANLLHNRTPAHSESVIDIQKIFCQDTKSKIVVVLRLLLENEGSSESLRQRLKSKSEMSGHEAFKYLDLKGDGAITSDELIEVFQKNDTFLTEREVRLLMDRLDQDKDGNISYYELLSAISPKIHEIC